MNVEWIRTLYGYNAWANRRILDTAAQLTSEQLKAPGRASFDSIHATLVHTMSAHWIWLSRWQGISPRAMLDPATFATLADIRARWQQIEQETQAVLDNLDESLLEQAVIYTNTKGRQNAYPLWQLMLHQVNHATQHRSEIAMILTELGYSPDWLDLIRYLDLQKAGKT